MNCKLCPRSCNAVRTDFENINGYCKMPLLPRVARADLHFWEEPCISGKKGSGTIFFSGCSLSCVYCQNFDLSHKQFGKDISIERLSEIFYELEQKGAHNINLVNPTHYSLAIKQALDIYRPNIPIVYNSGGYEKVEVLRELQDYIDIYLLDLKYLSCEVALKYSGAYDYPIVAQKAILECYRQKGECITQNGIMKKGVIIRHLLLPQGTNEAMRVFDWYHNNVKNAFFSIMGQYLPFGEAENIKPLNRKITRREYDKVLDYISRFDCENIYIQELSSSSKKYIPSFDLSGV